MTDHEDAELDEELDPDEEDEEDLFEDERDTTPGAGRLSLWAVSFVVLLIAGGLLAYGAVRRNASTSPTSLSWFVVALSVIAIVLAVSSLRATRR
ncbi:MAG: hypothetical protein WD004_00090 [Actinomycetota bacterium]